MFQIVDAKCMDDNIEALADQVDVIFTATPQGFLASVINENILGKTKIIDLSADFRIKDVNRYEEWYGIKHQSPEFIDEAVYGLCEITGPGVALDCIHHKGMHVQEDYFYPEVLNPTDHTPCKDGETGELVFTTLVKEGMPLLRYRTKDLTSIDHSKCECGRTLPRIHKFTGRTDDMKVIRGVNVFPSQIESVMANIDGISPHYELVLTRKNYTDYLEVRIEINDAGLLDNFGKLETLRQTAVAKLQTVLGIKAKVTLVAPKSLKRYEGKSKRIVDLRGKEE